MGVGGVFVAVPAAAAAAGLYFLERYHASSKVVGNELHSSKVNLLAKKMKRDQAKTSEQMPKLAPEFDGLNCFETLLREIDFLELSRWLLSTSITRIGVNVLEPDCSIVDVIGSFT